MKTATFNDIEFKKHPVFAGGKIGQLFFENGYGISVINGKGSYTRSSTEYEIAILKGNKEDWSLCYDTEITSDVIGYLSESEVEEYILKIQELL